MKDRIGACGTSAEKVEILQPADMAPRAFALGFAYGDSRSFAWRADLATAHATFDADFGAGRTLMPASVSLLSQESALSDAMFF